MIDEKRIPTEKGVEALAAVAHEQWSGWMRYLFDQTETLPSGDVVIPAHVASRWKRQIDTPYKKLSEEEKESDRAEAKRVIDAYEGRRK